MSDGYKGLMDRLLALPSCALIPLGRTGSDLLQSMFDSHPEVLSFNGHLAFHSFWKSSFCVTAGSYGTRDLLDEFIGKHIQRFKSRYDIWERKNQLGDELDQSIDIDLDRFRSEAISLLEGREVDPRTFLLTINAAYALCLGQDLEQKRLFFHHPHIFTELPSFLQDFPDSKIICMTRDPRANFVSGIEHHRNYNHLVDTDNGIHLLFQINRILNDAVVMEQFGRDYRVIRIEDLGREDILQTLCRWLNISYDPCLTRSTWAGLSWHSDRLSKVNREPGFSKAMLENQWEKRLSFTDKYVMNYVMNPRLKYYGYSHKKIGLIGALVVPFLILLPLSHELRFLSPIYIKNCIRKGQRLWIARNGLNYFRRVWLFLKYYLRVTSSRKFNQPLLRAEPAGLTPTSRPVAYSETTSRPSGRH